MDYLNAGVQRRWYVDPHLEFVHVYTPDYGAEIHQRGDTTTGGITIPHLNIRVDEIFECPSKGNSLKTGRNPSG